MITLKLHKAVIIIVAIGLAFILTAPLLVNDNSARADEKKPVPVVESYTNDNSLSLRDKIALSVLNNHIASSGVLFVRPTFTSIDFVEEDQKKLAKGCYQMADMMLKARDGQ